MLATLVGLSMLLALVGGWPPSGPCWPRPSAWAIGISGPASTATQRPSSSPTTRA